MIDDYESWTRTTNDALWLIEEPIMTQAESHRYFEAGLPTQAAVSRVLHDREAEDVIRLIRARTT